jgi:hypothetical protein
MSELLAMMSRAVGEVCILLARWLLFTRDPQLIDGCPQCHDVSLSARCWSVVFGVFVHVALWSLVLARVGAVWIYVRLNCGCVVIIVGFHPIFF